MSRPEFHEDCPGCRPAVVDPKTGKRESSDSPIMKVVDSIWERMGRDEREAFHRVTCLNSRVITDLMVVQKMSEDIEKALMN